MKYRSKETIEAFQITEESRKDNSNWPVWMNIAWQKQNDEPGSLYPSDFPDSDGKDKLAFTDQLGYKKIIEWGQYLINDPYIWVWDEEHLLNLFEPAPSQQDKILEQLDIITKAQDRIKELLAEEPGLVMLVDVNGASDQTLKAWVEESQKLKIEIINIDGQSH